MKFTVLGIGTRGDVQPLLELCRELKSRGHEVLFCTQDAFENMTKEAGIDWCHLSGSADHLMQYLVLENKGDLDFVKGAVTLFKEAPDLIDEMDEAVKNADVAIYNFLAGFAYHPCEKYGIPCVRVFYSPFDATEKYSLYTPEHNSKKVYDSFKMEEFGMNLLTVLLANKWRKANGLKKWTMKSDYRVQGDVPVETFYPVSPVLMEPDPKWGSYIHINGYWFHPQDDVNYEPDESLTAFLNAGDTSIFAGFGKMNCKEYETVQKMLLQVLKKTGVRAVVQLPLLSKEEKENAPANVYFIEGNIPYAWLFERVKGVIHHGGNSTNGLGLRAGKPTGIIALALDQYYYGRTVNELGLGPKPLYIPKKMCSEEELTEMVQSLAKGIYTEQAEKTQKVLLEENGCQTAAEILEKRFG